MEGLPLVKAISLDKEGKKGFGFSIDRGEKTQGSSAVMIASIIRGGPADIEGQMQVGDQVLSVDGQKILGYAYEKVNVMCVWGDQVLGYAYEMVNTCVCVCGGGWDQVLGYAYEKVNTCVCVGGGIKS